MEKPKLSICMIVKNEEGNLQRCLDSFLPIIQMKDDETLEPLTELIVVDSVPKYVPVIIKNRITDSVDILNIEELFDRVKNKIRKTSNGEEIKDCDNLDVWVRMKSCREENWTPINSILRHPYKGKIVRINSLDSIIDVTPNHSLFNDRGREISAGNIKIGDKILQGELKNCNKYGKGHSRKKIFCGSEEFAWLLGFFAAEGCALFSGGFPKINIANQNLSLLEKCKDIINNQLNAKCNITNPDKSNTRKVISNGRGIYDFFRNRFYNSLGEKKVPEEIINAPENIRIKFLDGYWKGDGHIAQEKYYSFISKSWVLTQGILWLLNSIGKYHWVAHTRQDKKNIVQIAINNTARRKKIVFEVKKITDLEYDGMVYDLCTSKGKFQAGIGTIFAHNTGSTDRTINIAKKFTDKIYKKEFIPWDFSKARNYGLKKATGDKIMYMDADEELRHGCLYPLEDIILNPKYEEPTVFVNLYNYYTRDLKQYSEMLQPRIFKNDKDLHFENAVHNKPIMKSPYLFASHIIFNHYGYVFQGEKGEKLLDNKMARSLPMLQKEFKEHPDNLHNLTHLVKTYYVTRDFENTIHYGEIWVGKMRKENYNEGWNSFLEVFVNLVGSYLAKDDIKNAERIEREACHYSSRISQIYLMLGNYWTSKDNEKAKKYFDIALDICKTKGSLYERLLINNTKIVLPEILNWLAIYEFERKNYEKAGEYMNEGIRLNINRLPIRWDIFLATAETSKNLIPVLSR